MVFLSFSSTVVLFYMKVPTLEQKVTRKSGRPTSFNLWLEQHKLSKNKEASNETLREPNKLSFR
jgi:hypothetical protein